MDQTPAVNRVLRTFGFVDISGFTTFTDQFGDSASVRALATFRSVCRDEASHHGVRIDKWLGDGAMFVGVDSRPLIAALLDISTRLRSERFPLELRVGIANGMVILFEGDDYIGTPVNLASRLCGEAGPGQIFVTEAVAALSPRGITQTALGPFEIRGIQGPVHVVELAGGFDRATH